MSTYLNRELDRLDHELRAIEKSKTMSRVDKQRAALAISEQLEELTAKGGSTRLPAGITYADLARGCGWGDDLLPSAENDAEAHKALYGVRGRGHGSLLPLAFDKAAVKELGERARSGAPCRIVSKAASLDGLLPARLAPGVLGPVHEQRLLDFLPTTAASGPSIEYIRHSGSTGGPATVPEGGLKPELVPTIDTLVCTVRKIAVHGAVTHEAMLDYNAFADYFQGELIRTVIDVETAQLLNGDGTGTNLTGLTKTSGILTSAVSTAPAETNIDAIERAVAEMRVGSALAVADVIVMHPTSWSIIRRSKDSYGRYMVAADPTRAEANSLWGIPVVVTTAATVGTVVLLDTAKFGTVYIREGITVQTGASGDDFVHNVARFVVEERLGLAVTRPSAIYALTGVA